MSLRNRSVTKRAARRLRDAFSEDFSLPRQGAWWRAYLPGLIQAGEQKLPAPRLSSGRAVTETQSAAEYFARSAASAAPGGFRSYAYRPNMTGHAGCLTPICANDFRVASSNDGVFDPPELPCPRWKTTESLTHTTRLPASSVR